MTFSKLKTYGKILIGLLGLTIVIVVHEFGHYFACKLFNVRTPVFSVGFDPALISFKPKKTKFQIGAIPLGGYVSINTEDLEKQSYIKKMIIILAGIAFNILFAVIVLYYLYFKNQLQKKEFTGRYDFSETEEQEGKSSLVSFLIKATPSNAREALYKDQKDSFIGPIGIVWLMGRSIELGFDVFLYFLAIISLNIAFFNLLPIPFFDGGQAFGITFEALLGKTISAEWTNLIYIIFFILLLLFSLFLSIKDVRRFKKQD